MKLVRTLALAAVTAVVTFGLVGISAPAHADISWGYSIHKKL